jgi:hypothetical protein
MGKISNFYQFFFSGKKISLNCTPFSTVNYRFYTCKFGKLVKICTKFFALVKKISTFSLHLQIFTSVIFTDFTPVNW